MSTITPQIDSGLDHATKRLADAAGTNLVSLIAANGPLAAAESDSRLLSVLIVLKSASPGQLSAIADPARTIEEIAGYRPFVVTHADLRTSTDVFPIRYRNLQHEYSVLAGTDVLADLTFDLEHVRLRCEQELSNVLIRLRNRYVADHGNPSTMAATLQRAAVAFLITLRTAIELQTGLAPDDLDGIFADAETALGLKSNELLAIREAASGLQQPSRESIDRVFGLFARSAEKAVALVDRMDPKSGERV